MPQEYEAVTVWWQVHPKVYDGDGRGLQEQYTRVKSLPPTPSHLFGIQRDSLYPAGGDSRVYLGVDMPPFIVHVAGIKGKNQTDSPDLFVGPWAAGQSVSIRSSRARTSGRKGAQRGMLHGVRHATIPYSSFIPKAQKRRPYSKRFLDVHRVWKRINPIFTLPSVACNHTWQPYDMDMAGCTSCGEGHECCHGFCRTEESEVRCPKQT